VVVEAANPIVGGEFVVKVEVAITKCADGDQDVVAGTVGVVVRAAAKGPAQGPQQGLEHNKEERPCDTTKEETALQTERSGSR